MITRNELTTYLADYLNISFYQDYAPNGLQIEGKPLVARIATAVTASEAVILEACAADVDALIVHHGFFWRGEEPTISGMKRRRIQAVLAHDLNLLAYHLPLDCHLTLGNNACIAQLLDVVDVQTHAHGKTRDLLWSGQLRQTMPVQAFSQLLSQLFSPSPRHVAAKQSMITRVAWCSGAAQDLIDDAVTLGADAYVSGEISERTYYQAKEQDIHYFACGHHATERYGIQALGAHLAEQFGLSHVFIDAENPI